MATGRTVMPKCPQCKTQGYVVPLRFCERTGTAVGGIAGIILACMLEKDKADPVDVCHALAKKAVDNGQSTLSCLLVGLTTGNKIGGMIDNHILSLYRCNQCGHWFSG